MSRNIEPTDDSTTESNSNSTTRSVFTTIFSFLAKSLSWTVSVTFDYLVWTLSAAVTAVFGYVFIGFFKLVSAPGRLVGRYTFDKTYRAVRDGDRSLAAAFGTLAAIVAGLFAVSIALYAVSRAASRLYAYIRSDDTSDSDPASIPVQDAGRNTDSDD